MKEAYSYPYSANAIVNYIFGDVSQEEELIFSKAIEKDTFLSKVIDSLMDYCLLHKVSKERLLELIETQSSNLTEESSSDNKDFLGLTNLYTKISSHPKRREETSPNDAIIRQKEDSSRRSE